MIESTHPVWGLLRALILCLTLAFILWLNTAKFDLTEWAIIAEFALALMLFRVLRYLVGRLKD